MASIPITSWEIEGEKVEAVTDFLFLDSKITADGDCSHEIKRPLLLGRKGMTNLDSVEKQRHYSADKGLYSQSYGLPSGHVWLCELDHKEGRPPKNWCLRTVVLEKTPDSSLETWRQVSRPSNQSILREMNPEYSLERLMLRLKLQYFGHLMQSAGPLENSLIWERLRAEREEGVRKWDGWTESLMRWTWTWANARRWWGTGWPGMLQSMGSQIVWHDWATEQQQMVTRLNTGVLRDQICRGKISKKLVDVWRSIQT